ncbi:MAG: hypothetical protein H0T18_02145 [Chloroflexia bacterium]|nr:hypothetical protein [Chloroflexia bacterium]
MSPEDLAAKHPYLYHVTDSRNLPGIKRYGLLPTSSLLSKYEVPCADRAEIERRRRPDSVTLTQPDYGTAIITDNAPLSETKLMNCLDDGLSPGDWLALLNQRFFFWPDEKSREGFLNARINWERDRLVLVLDTLSVARRHGEQMELSAINSGSTLRRPARRGLCTFTPLLRHDYATWRRLRGKLDHIREVAVVGGVDRVDDHLIEHYVAPGRAL